MKKMNAKNNTLSESQVFALLHSVQMTETPCSDRLVKNNVQVVVNAYGLIVAEIWPVAFGFEVWYNLKPDCNIFNPYFSKKKRCNTQVEVDEFITELL